MKCALHLNVGLDEDAITVSAGWAVCERCARHVKPWLPSSANEAAILKRVSQLGSGRES